MSSVLIQKETILVTGASGFIGMHLLHHIATNDNAQRIVCAGRREFKPEVGEFRRCDLVNQVEVAELLKEVQPILVLHLAGSTNTRSPTELFNSNMLASHNLVTALASNSSGSHFVNVGSAAQYGFVRSCTGKIGEDSPLNPISAYGVSKYFQEQWISAICHQTSVSPIFLRPFNVMGPGQSEQLVPMTFLSQIGRLNRGELERVEVGNLDSVRDFLDVRDLVKAVWKVCLNAPLLSEEVINICSGQGTSISILLDLCMRQAKTDAELVQNRHRIRERDVSVVIGDNSKICRVTDWRPEIALDESISEMWDSFAS